MIDNHGRARPSLANRQIKSLEEFNLLFFEEPVPPENIEALQQIRDASHNTDIATEVFRALSSASINCWQD